jgi:endonuclease/exonuclease/phosphatase family metal-dependent hydrolase
MSMESTKQQSEAAGVAVVALVVVLGGQMVRVFIPLVGWYLRDIKSVGTLDLMPFALAPFAASLLVPLVVRAVGARPALWLSVGSLAVARLVEQLITDPATDLWVSMAGVALFLWSVPLLAGFVGRTTAPGLVLGLAADTALKGSTRTLDLSWITGLWPVLAVAVLAGATVVLLFALRPLTDPVWWSGRQARATFLLAPLLLLEWMVLQNQGWVTTATGWPSAAALLLIAAANAAALFSMGRLPAGGSGTAAINLAGGVVLFAVAATAFDLTGLFFAVLLVAGILAGAWLFTGVFAREPDSGRIGATATMFGLGNLVLVIVALVYFVSLDLDLGGLTNRHVLAALGVVVLLASAMVAFRGAVHSQWVGRRPRWAGAALMLVPVGLVTADLVQSSPEPSATGVVTVVSYNLHSGFDGTGIQNPEAMAQIIEQSGADVVGLQEVSRGWFLNGGTDLVAWMSNRLDMPHRFFAAAADPAWGNAILSRYPLTDHETGLLPRGLVPFQRSYQAATLDLGDARTFLLINTHLQHIDDSSIPDEERERDLAPLHRRQLEVVLEGWADRPSTVLTGDLNARPGWEQMDYLLAAGFEDALAGVDPVEAHTSGYWSNNGVARWRIDWVIHTPDLQVASARVIADDISDHYPVVVELVVP